MLGVPGAAFLDALFVTKLEQVLDEVCGGARSIWPEEIPMEVEVGHEGRIYTTEAQGHRGHRA